MVLHQLFSNMVRLSWLVTTGAKDLSPAEMCAFQHSWRCCVLITQRTFQAVAVLTEPSWARTVHAVGDKYQRDTVLAKLGASTSRRAGSLAARA